MSAANASLNLGPAKQRYHAFLSHSGAETSLIEELAYGLEQRGLSCWLDTWNLIAGDPWQPAIEEALGQCDTCVVFFGPHGLGPWQNEEMRLAIQRRVNAQNRSLRVLLVILPGGQRAKESDVPGFLQGTTWVRFERSIDEKDALHRLECGIRGIPVDRKPTIPEGKCPYLGLKTFQPEDAALFYGRTAKVQELVDRLRTGLGSLREERFLALIGASGSGKSSLALAGLIPAIRRGELPGSAGWPLVRCRPGARPWESLQIALASNQQTAPYLAMLPALAPAPEDEQRRLHLTARLALHDAPETHRLFVLIDQFEEMFTLCNDAAARRPFIDNVLYAASVAEGRTIVVLTMRADFYGQCTSYPSLSAAISDHQSLIVPLSEDELREAIETPAKMASGELEPGLTERLLSDMRGQAGALPFLGDALLKLWESRSGRCLTAKAYGEMGRLEGAMDAHAEDFFGKLRLEEQGLCRQLLLNLVHPGEGAAADSKKRAAIDDVASTEAARVVLKKLADTRLVILTGEQAQAELAHEALIGGWRRLGNWVNENRENSQLKGRLLDSAREWQKNKKGGDFLYRGTRLAAAEESFGSSSQSLPRLAREFLEASVAERNHEQQERQREHDEKERQQQRELETQRARAQAEEERAKAEEARANTERKSAERQRQAASKLRRLAWILAGVALLAILAGFFALRLKAEAEHQAASAEKARIASDEALRRYFVRIIGVSDGSELTADERTALWELAELDAANENVRRLLIYEWLEKDDVDLLIRPLKNSLRGLHAAIGLNESLAAYFHSRTGRTADRLAEALVNPRETNPDRLSSISHALAAVAARTDSNGASSEAARGASVLVKALENPQEMDSDRLSSLGESLAAVAAWTDPNSASSEAARGASVLVKALENPQETDSFRLRSFGETLAAFADGMDREHAAGVADRLVKALENPQETDSDRLSALGEALAAFGAGMDPKNAIGVADRLPKALENPQETDSDRLSTLREALAAFGAGMDRKNAIGAADRLAKALESPRETNFDRLSSLGEALAAFAGGMAPKDAASVADRLAKALESPQETNFDRLSSLGDALAVLAACMDSNAAASVAARGASVLARTLESPQETDSDRLSSLGDALAVLAAHMDPNAAASAAARGASVLAKALESPQETNFDRLSSLGDALAALIACMDFDDATRVAARGASVLAKALENPQADSILPSLDDAPAAPRLRTLRLRPSRLPVKLAPVPLKRHDISRLVDRQLRLRVALVRLRDALVRLRDALVRLRERMDPKDAASVATHVVRVLENPQVTDSSRLSSLGDALEAFAERMDPKDAASLATRLVTVLENPRETSDRLSSLGEALAELTAQIPSARQTQLVALSNLFLEEIAGPPEDGEGREGKDRTRVKRICEVLNAEELAGVLKWPLCVGNAQMLVFSELEKKIKERIDRTFDEDIWKFVAQVDSLGIDGLDRRFLDQPAKRPKAQDALEELEAIRAPLPPSPSGP